jgi:hypothetical protein
MRQKPIDVKFSEVGKKRKAPWWETPYLVADMLQLVFGCALLGFAGYCFSLIG